jgi:hypothetical protein
VRERRVPGDARAADAAPLFFERVRFVPRDGKPAA